MADLKLSVIINAVDRMTDTVRRQQNELGKLGRMNSDIEHFRKLKRESQQTDRALEQSRQEASRLGRELANTAKPTARLRREFRAWIKPTRATCTC